jgi:hypothetical protein
MQGVQRGAIEIRTRVRGGKDKRRGGAKQYDASALRPSNSDADIVTGTPLIEGMVAVARADHPLASRRALTFAQPDDARRMKFIPVS